MENSAARDAPLARFGRPPLPTRPPPTSRALTTTPRARLYASARAPPPPPPPALPTAARARSLYTRDVPARPRARAAPRSPHRPAVSPGGLGMRRLSSCGVLGAPRASRGVPAGRRGPRSLPGPRNAAPGARPRKREYRSALFRRGGGPRPHSTGSPYFACADVEQLFSARPTWRPLSGPLPLLIPSTPAPRPICVNGLSGFRSLPSSFGRQPARVVLVVLSVLARLFSGLQPLYVPAMRSQLCLLPEASPSA